MGLDLQVRIPPIGHMNLEQYRKQMGWTLDEAASFASFANATVWRRYETGERYPRPEALETILRLTAGQVTADDMLKTRRAWERARDAERNQSAPVDRPKIEETAK